MASMTRGNRALVAVNVAVWVAAVIRMGLSLGVTSQTAASPTGGVVPSSTALTNPAIPVAGPATTHRLGGGFRGIRWGSTIDEVIAVFQDLPVITHGTPYTNQQPIEGLSLAYADSSRNTSCGLAISYQVRQGRWMRYGQENSGDCRWMPIARPPRGLLIACFEIHENQICVFRNGNGVPRTGRSEDDGVNWSLVRVRRSGDHQTDYRFDDGRLVRVTPYIRNYNGDYASLHTDYVERRRSLEGVFGPPTSQSASRQEARDEYESSGFARALGDQRAAGLGLPTGRVTHYNAIIHEIFSWEDGETIVTLLHDRSDTLPSTWMDLKYELAPAFDAARQADLNAHGVP